MGALETQEKAQTKQTRQLARLLRDEGVGGSNPLTPTNKTKRLAPRSVSGANSRARNCTKEMLRLRDSLKSSTYTQAGRQNFAVLHFCPGICPSYRAHIFGGPVLGGTKERGAQSGLLLGNLGKEAEAKRFRACSRRSPAIEVAPTLGADRDRVPVAQRLGRHIAASMLPGPYRLAAARIALRGRATLPRDAGGRTWTRESSGPRCSK